jgi:dolichol-phosphate mannosyltransferase
MISILLPTRNEPLAHILVAGIRETMKEISEPYEIVAVDKSDDGTYERLNELKVTVLRQKSEGLGGALLEGLKAVQGDVVIAMDADLSHDPKYIPSFIKKARESFDVVIGSRRMPGGGIVGWSWQRKLVSFGGNFRKKDCWRQHFRLNFRL